MNVRSLTLLPGLCAATALLAQFGTPQNFDLFNSGVDLCKAGDLTGDGVPDLVFAWPGGGITPSISWCQGLGAGRFGPPNVLSNTSYGAIIQLTLADIENDGDLDVFISDSGARIHLYRNDSVAQFAGPEVIFDVSGQADFWFGVGDMDANGHKDVVISLGSNGTVGWLQQDTVGNFAPIAEVGMTVGSPAHVTLGDMDNDGDLDIVATCNGGAAWCANVGGGAFGATSNIVSSAGAWYNGLALTDLDNDLDLDVVLSTPTSSNTSNEVHRVDNLGTGVFGAVITIDTDLWSSTDGVLAGDMNGDGFDDVIVIGRAFTSNVEQPRIYMNDGAGGLTAPVVLPAEGPKFGTCHDLDQDGDLDLAFCEIWRMNWIANDGTGTFQDAGTIYAYHGFVNSGQVVDMDGDGDNDVALCMTGGAVWLENDGEQVFDTVHYFMPATREYGQSMFVADMDQDAVLDVVIAYTGPDKVCWFKGLGGGAFAPRQWLPDTYGPPREIIPADVDSDGDLDVIGIMEYYFQGVRWINTGGGTFTVPTYPQVSPYISPIERVFAVDMDLDGDPDPVFAAPSPERAVWVENDGFDGPWVTYNVSLNVADASTLALGDIDQDGDPDAVLERLSDHAVIARRNDGTGGFAPAYTVLSGGSNDIKYMRLEDLNVDGLPDLLIQYEYPSIVLAWARSLGGGSFAAPVTLLTGSLDWSRSMITGDIDGDNDPDVVYTDFLPFQQLFWLGNEQISTSMEASSQTTQDQRPWNAVALSSDRWLIEHDAPLPPNANVVVTDMQGRSALQVPLNHSTRTVIDVGGLPAGLYLLHMVQDDGGWPAVKLVKP